jgi:hypothetical protein
MKEKQNRLPNNAGSYMHQGAGTIVPNTNTGKVQSQYRKVRLIDEKGWTDHVAVYRTTLV